MDPGLTVEAHGEPDAGVLSLRGELDVSTIAIVQEAIAGVNGGTVVLDLTDLRFVDSAGIGCFARAHVALSEAGRALELRDPQPAIRRVIELTGLDREIRVTPAP